MLCRVREIHLAFFDQEIHSVLITVEEGRHTHEDLVKEDAEGPPIYCVVVPTSDNHLRRQVLGRPTERVGKLVL